MLYFIPNELSIQDCSVEKNGKWQEQVAIQFKYLIGFMSKTNLELLQFCFPLVICELVLCSKLLSWQCKGFKIFNDVSC